MSYSILPTLRFCSSQFCLQNLISQLTCDAKVNLWYFPNQFGKSYLCLEYAANYRRIIVCWHPRSRRRMAVCARQPCICAGSIRLCAWILRLCGPKHRAQIQKCSRTNGVSQWPHTGKKSPHDSEPRKWKKKKRHAQGFPVFDTAEMAAYSKHGGCGKSKKVELKFQLF